MDISDSFGMAALSAAMPLEPAMGRGTRRPDMPRLLAVLAARQRVLPTARAVRDGEIGMFATSPAERMARLFGHVVVPGSFRRSGAEGAFNIPVARLLAASEQGEGDIYRGA